MSSATLALVVLVTVVLISALVIRLLRPRRREGPASENSASLAGWVNAVGHTADHDMGSRSLPIDAPSHSGIDTGSHSGVDSGSHGGPAP
jgi:hypothetical protein